MQRFSRRRVLGRSERASNQSLEQVIHTQFDFTSAPPDRVWYLPPSLWAALLHPTTTCINRTRSPRPTSYCLPIDRATADRATSTAPSSGRPSDQLSRYKTKFVATLPTTTTTTATTINVHAATLSTTSSSFNQPLFRTACCPARSLSACLPATAFSRLLYVHSTYIETDRDSRQSRPGTVLTYRTTSSENARILFFFLYP